jgi:hypothetical protein
MTASDSPGNSTRAAGPGALRVSGRRGWDQHPGVRTGRRLRPGERIADVFCRVAGPWAYLIMIAAGVLAGAAAALPHDSHAGGLTRLGVGLSALALVEVSLMLMAGRRAERIATELALYNLDQARRATAIAEDLRGEMERLHADVARIAAHTEKAGYAARQD